MILIPLGKKYREGQFKGISRRKGDNQPDKIFKAPNGKLYRVPRQSGKSGIHAQQPVGWPRGKHDPKNAQTCRCGGCGAKHG